MQLTKGEIRMAGGSYTFAKAFGGLFKGKSLVLTNPKKAMSTSDTKQRYKSNRHKNGPCEDTFSCRSLRNRHGCYSAKAATPM